MLFNSASGHSGDAPGQVRAYSVLQLGKVLLGLAVSVPVSAYTEMIAHQIHTGVSMRGFRRPKCPNFLMLSSPKGNNRPLLLPIPLKYPQ